MFNFVLRQFRLFCTHENSCNLFRTKFSITRRIKNCFCTNPRNFQTLRKKMCKVRLTDIFVHTFPKSNIASTSSGIGCYGLTPVELYNRRRGNKPHYSPAARIQILLYCSAFVSNLSHFTYMEPRQNV